MMANAKKIVLGLMLLLGSNLALAEGKVVVLDLQAAVLSTDAAQQRLQALEQNEEYAALRTRFESLTADLQAFQEDAQKNAMTWSEEKKKQKQEEAQKLRQEYERTGQTLQGERQRVMQAVMQQMGGKTQEILAQLIEAENIGLVLNSQSAFHASDEYDITAKVTEMLNKANASAE
ncbi:OmpH family outer membrane protein [Marinimicrobium agarilyticum]|uniref:OmpH family outer membrane protein n=1 Tax=Marinimicrobium agarilyticum TaxID=306546 RepID=UPI0003F73836|nr:OmpH family outer membrane protein [Marinimicrobium agarilyticum]